MYIAIYKQSKHKVDVSFQRGLSYQLHNYMLNYSTVSLYINLICLSLYSFLPAKCLLYKVQSRLLYREFLQLRNLKTHIINLGVGRHGGQEGVEVCPVGTVTCVVTLFIEAWQRNGANSRVYEKEAEEEK